MEFTSVLFLVFFAITLMGVRFAPAGLKKYILIIANLIFYLTNGIVGCTVLIGISVICYFAGILLTGKAAESRLGKIIVPCISIGTIGLLLLLHITKVYYPLGLSFYSLMAVGYVIDVYMGKTEPVKKYPDLFLVLSFFPIIQSGPIEKTQNIVTQLKKYEDEPHDREYFDNYHFVLILWGFLEKIAVSNIAGILVGEIFDNYANHSGISIILATILYAFQLYADFDGYSNIALGTAGLLGISITRNFKQPYLSSSVKEFWRRWHISLSTWLKDYVYIPLGGSRCSSFRKYFNLFITFIVSGIWHGTGVNFLIWGALHGLFQIIEDAIGARKKLLHSENRKSKPAGIIKTFILVDFAWFFFRAGSLSNVIGLLGRFKGISVCPQGLSGLLNEFGEAGLNSIHLIYMIAALLLLIVIDIIENTFSNKEGMILSDRIYLIDIIAKLPMLVRWIICYGLIFWIILAGLSVMSMDLSGFIYGQF